MASDLASIGGAPAPALDQDDPADTGELAQWAQVAAGSRLRRCTRRSATCSPVRPSRPIGDSGRRSDGSTSRRCTLHEAAGFEVVRIQTYDAPHVLPSAEAAVRFSEASSFGNLLGHLPPGLRASARAALVGALAALARPDGSLVREGRRTIAIATRPARR